MSVLLDPPRTVATLLHRLGDIPPERVRLQPTPGTATREDLLKTDNEKCELIDGTLVEKAMGFRESGLAGLFIELLRQFVRKYKLGIVTAPDGTYELAPGLVRLPDVAFISWDRLPDRRYPANPIPKVSPNLAVEVLSKGNTRAEMARKRDDYFKAGVQLVWEVNSRKRIIRVYAEATEYTELAAGDILSGQDVLPGFAVPVSELFAELDEPG